MNEPWVNFTDAAEQIDRAIFLREDRKERVHVYERPNGTFGCQNFHRVKEDLMSAFWTVGSDWGHHYDSMSTAIREAGGRYPWLGEILAGQP